MVAIAAPVRRGGGETVAAIAALGPPDRMSRDIIEMLSAEVRRAAEQIAESYGRF